MAAGEHSVNHRLAGVAMTPRPVTDLGTRLLLTLAVLALAAAAYLLMRRGWRRRARSQATLPPLPPPPAADGPALLDPLPGLYVGTTRAGDWLDRIAAQDLSARARGRLRLTATGVTVDRDGASTLFLPGPAIRDARVDSAHAGKVVGPGGVLVITWELGRSGPDGGALLDTGFRADHHDQHDVWVRALRHLATPATPGATTSATTSAATEVAP